MERQMMDGFPIKPMNDFIFIADLGQPNKSHGGIELPDEDVTFARYKLFDERYGMVVAIGPGRRRWSKLLKKEIIDPDLEDLGLSLGDIVIFNRRMGSRLGIKWQPPGVPIPVFIRVLDPMKALARVDGFEPWWDLEKGILNPDGIMTG